MKYMYVCMYLSISSVRISAKNREEENFGPPTDVLSFTTPKLSMLTYCVCTFLYIDLRTYVVHMYVYMYIYVLPQTSDWSINFI